MATTILHLQSLVATQLARSRSFAIDIYLDFDADSKALQYTELLKMREDTFYLVLDHVQRWRRVKLRLPFSNAIFGQLMSDNPLPLLEDLCLFPHEECDNMDVSWLSSAPALRRLSSPDAHFSFATASSTIVSADLQVSDSTLGSFLNTFSHLPRIEYLGLTFTNAMDGVFTSEYAVLLNALRSLKLRGGWCVFNQFLTLGIIASNLLRLNFARCEVVHTESHRRFSQAFPVTIVDLEVEGSWDDYNSLDSYDGASLYHFGHLKSLSISRCTIGDPFFLRMVGLGEAFHGRQWPELEMLTVSLYHHRGRNAPSFSDLAHAIWSLASAYRGRERAFSVALESWPSLFPSWFRRALGALLGPSNVRLTSCGVIYDAAGESDEEEEKEAQFTDDTAESDSSGDEDEASDSSRHSEGIRVDGPDCQRRTPMTWTT